MKSLGDTMSNTRLGHAMKSVTNWFSFKILDYYKASEKETLKLLHEYIVRKMAWFSLTPQNFL